MGTVLVQRERGTLATRRENAFCCRKCVGEGVILMATECGGNINSDALAVSLADRVPEERKAQDKQGSIQFMGDLAL